MEKLVRFIFSKRFIIYVAGIIVLAFGITLNTKTGLGVSPIVSVAYSVSEITDIPLGIMTFLWYMIMIALQAALLRKDFKVYQLLQIGASFLTSWFIGLFDLALPEVNSLWARILLLAAAIVITAVGVVLTVGMDVVPNPADGFAGVLGAKLGKGLGFGKNVFDLSSIVIAGAVGFIFRGQLIGIGLGTVFTMIFTGRVIAFIHKRSGNFFWDIAHGQSAAASGQTE